MCGLGRGGRWIWRILSDVHIFTSLLYDRERSIGSKNDPGAFYALMNNDG